MLTIYNSLTRTQELFQPLIAGKVKIYVCGITVYDHCHLGHARSMLCFDVIIRYLRFVGYEVTYVRNITDIDDKIIVRAQAEKISIAELTSRYIQSMHEDTKALNILPPDIEPRATAHIATIITLIEKLVANEFAYINDQGDVCFEVDRFKEYGKLSRKDLSGLIAGARVEIVKAKRNPYDFVLWKKAKPGEDSWPSPWGEGRPGWHIECSAMAIHELGEEFDIHGGGLDLQFPHHENEIAQSEGATGKSFAKYWLHVGMLQINQEKMAKSANNFFTIKELLAKHHPEVLRYFLLSNHYRSSLNYSEENLKNAAKSLTRLYQSIRAIKIANQELDKQWLDKFIAAMNDDFNTPEALSVLFQLSHELNSSKSPQLAFTLAHLASTLGLLQIDPEIFLQSGIEEEERQRITQLIQERETARIERNWIRADEIRNLLAAEGIDLEDSSAGTIWRKRKED